MFDTYIGPKLTKFVVAKLILSLDVAVLLIMVGCLAVGTPRIMDAIKSDEDVKKRMAKLVMCTLIECTMWTMNVVLCIAHYFELLRMDSQIDLYLYYSKAVADTIILSYIQYKPVLTKTLIRIIHGMVEEKTN